MRSLREIVYRRPECWRSLNDAPNVSLVSSSPPFSVLTCRQNLNRYYRGQYPFRTDTKSDTSNCQISMHGSMFPADRWKKQPEQVR